MLTQENVSQALSNAISRRGWSVAEFSRRSGIPKGTAQQMVAGTALTLKNIDKALTGLELDWYSLIEQVTGETRRGEPEEAAARYAVTKEQMAATIVRLTRQHEEIDELRTQRIEAIESSHKKYRHDVKEFIARLFASQDVGRAEQIRLVARISAEMGDPVEILTEETSAYRVSS